MSSTAARNRTSLAGRFTLLTGAVIALCLVMVLVAAYDMMTRSAISGTKERLTRSTHELAAIADLGLKQNRIRYITASRSPALIEALNDRNTRENAGNHSLATEKILESARQVLLRLVMPTDSGLVVELWDAKGQRVTRVGPGQSVTAAPPVSSLALGARAMMRQAVAAVAVPDSMGLSPLYESNGRVYFWLVVSLKGRHGVIGYIAHERRIASNTQADRSARALAGEGVTAYYGNADGTLWATVGGTPVTPPERGNKQPTDRRAGEEVLTATAPIAGTPLQILMQSRLDDVLAAPRTALRRLLIVGTLLMLAGMGAALLIGRRVARPIVAIADAAEGIARGRYDVRVPAADITEIARLAESFNHMANEVAAAEETRRELAHMGRVAAVAELAASISHELRQPLTAIRSNAEAGLMLLTPGTRDLEEATESFRSIVGDCDRAAEVINQIRLLLRKEPPATMMVDLNEICRQAVHLLQHDAALRHTILDLMLAPSPLTVVGDPVQLQQVVLNLSLNALDAASGSRSQRTVRVSATLGKGVAEIAIRDSGPGIPSEAQPHLFEPFFTTKDPSKGTGLGLSIVYGIAKDAGGTVTFSTAPNQGTTFEVLLPLIDNRG
jgi:signal transduction histidine kinase